MLILLHSLILVSFKKYFFIIDIHAPIKYKFIRANEVPNMTKSLRKAIMTRSRLENKIDG